MTAEGAKATGERRLDHPHPGDATVSSASSIARSRTTIINLPIALTLVRIVLVPLVMVFLISSERVHVLIAAVIFVAASLTDWLDGRIARRLNQVTKLGTLLDPVADKLLVAAAFVSLVQVEMVPAWMAVVIIGRELAVTGLRGVALSMGILVPASVLGKWKTVSQYVAVTVLILEKGVSPDFLQFHLLSGAILWVTLAITVVSGAHYFYGFFLSTDSGALVKEKERWP